jgi:hypothetical protein
LSHGYDWIAKDITISTSLLCCSFRLRNKGEGSERAGELRRVENGTLKADLHVAQISTVLVDFIRLSTMTSLAKSSKIKT